MIIPVIWRSQHQMDRVPAWGTQIPPAIPAQSPFAAERQQEALEAWRTLSGSEAHLLHLDAVGPTCLQVQDEARIHLLMAGPMEICQIWPLVHEVLVLPLEGDLTDAWLPSSWTGRSMKRFVPAVAVPGAPVDARRKKSINWFAPVVATCICIQPRPMAPTHLTSCSSGSGQPSFQFRRN
jgi:hypothetical protein